MKNRHRFVRERVSSGENNTRKHKTKEKESGENKGRREGNLESEEAEKQPRIPPTQMRSHTFNV